ncbi:MAG: phosphodiester glycosidase family protein [Aphanothece sp. CMT-3BRIN-NPC111]|nr:phosphodiester glycosidase family protein [Aphanothece sp. CMT-3BRIN-NPC111]
MIRNAQTFVPPVAYSLLDLIDGAGLYKTQLSDGNLAYLQVVDLRKMQMEQIVGEVDKVGVSEGKYYGKPASYYSPSFQMKLFSDVWNEYKLLYGKQVFSMMNCAFFEEYKSSTQLAFPVKLNGQIATAGSSPYGPFSQAAEDYYKSIKLKALVWNDKSAYITDYDPEIGSPLDEPTVQNAIVSYRYSDHPAKVLGKNPANKYHVIGTLNKDNAPGDEWILIVTVNKATLDEAADLLQKLGVRGDIITVDGGSSTFISNPRTGNLLAPQPVNMKDNPNARNLPHYLGFRKKGDSKELPQIVIQQPATPIPIRTAFPYLILWRDNLAGEVKIELYQGSKLVKTLASNTASDGVFEWTPDTPVLQGSVIRVTSLEHKNVFGSLQLNEPGLTQIYRG